MNKRLIWSVVEEEALRAGVAKHGPGKWRTIRRDPEFSHALCDRLNVDLKDKWRNMQGLGDNALEKLPIRENYVKMSPPKRRANRVGPLRRLRETLPSIDDEVSVDCSMLSLSTGETLPSTDAVIMDSSTSLQDEVNSVQDEVNSHAAN